MNNRIFKYIKWLQYLLFAIAAAAFAMLLIYSSLYPQPSPEFAGSAGAARGVAGLLWLSYAVLAAAIAVTVGFAVAGIIKNPSRGRHSLIMTIILAVLFGVCLLFASDTPMPKTIGGYFDNRAALKWVDTGLYAAYVMLAVALGAIMVFEVRDSLMRRTNKKERNAEE